MREHRGGYPSLRATIESDCTDISTVQGWQYAAFVIDVFALRIVGWRVSRSMRTDFVLDALEQALFNRQAKRSEALIHHLVRGAQYVSIHYTERLAKAAWICPPPAQRKPTETEQSCTVNL